MTLTWLHRHSGNVCRTSSHNATCDNLADEIGCYKIPNGTFKGQCACIHLSRATNYHYNVDKSPIARRTAVGRSGARASKRRTPVARRSGVQKAAAKRRAAVRRR